MPTAVDVFSRLKVKFQSAKDWKRACLYNYLRLLGDYPNPLASCKALEGALQLKLFLLSQGKEINPEVPDNMLMFILPIELKLGRAPADTVTMLTTPAMTEAMLTGAGTIQAVANDIEDEGFFDNLQDGWQMFSSGNYSGWVNEIGDTINDLFT